MNSQGGSLYLYVHLYQLPHCIREFPQWELQWGELMSKNYRNVHTCLLMKIHKTLETYEQIRIVLSVNLWSVSHCAALIRLSKICPFSCLDNTAKYTHTHTLSLWHTHTGPICMPTYIQTHTEPQSSIRTDWMYLPIFIGMLIHVCVFVSQCESQYAPVSMCVSACVCFRVCPRWPHLGTPDRLNAGCIN